MRQWHPIFASLLRPVVEPYYELRTDLPVGEAPRKADMVLLRRVARGSLPFRTLWKFLTPWNVLEFKGPSVSPRSRDIDRLIELGLGIDRRLNEERAGDGLRILDRGDVSFWYICNHVGRGFLHNTGELLPGLEPVERAIWRCIHMGRSVYLVSGAELPVDEESLPVHLASEEGRSTELAVARLIAEKESLWKEYGGWLSTLHPAISKEFEAMAQKLGRRPLVDFRPVIDRLGVSVVIDQVGLSRVIAEVGLDRVIAEVGVDRVIAEVGESKLMDKLLTRLSPARRRELKRRLERTA